jgi:hypothetical protein
LDQAIVVPAASTVPVVVVPLVVKVLPDAS